MFEFISIEQYHAQLSAGTVTCVQAVQHYIQAINKNNSLNAFLEVFGDDAIERASELDNIPVAERKGKLFGVVMGIKDLLCYKGHQTTASSKILSGYISLYSGTAIERLLAEDAIIIGRQNCDEFGMGSTNENSAYGPVLNSVDTSMVPGGSSGGSAVAVKAGLCMASLGSDTGGSVRLPADFCGTIGFKPSYGRVSRHGLIAYASSFDQIGILANTPNDVAIILEVIAGADNYDSTVSSLPIENYSSPKDTGKKFRIAYFPEWICHPSIDPEIQSSLQNLLIRLTEAGHYIAPVSFTLTDYIVPTYYILTTAEASSNLARFDGVRYGLREKEDVSDLKEFYKQNRSKGFGEEVKRRIMLGTFVLSAGYYDAYFTKAQQVRRLLQNQTEEIFQDFDLLLAPNSPTTAYKAEQKNEDPLAMYMGDIFTVFANLTGIPSISLPVFKHSSNLPFGIQAMSNRFNEVHLLCFSHQLMQQ